LFLAQLSNLLAGNISIVHGVTGSSRTFMGEEASGADALRIACARIQARQSDICLVGGSFNAQRSDAFLHNAMGHKLWRGPFIPVGAREAHDGGTIMGSVGCFLVIESRGHAVARGVTPIARIAGIHTDRCRRVPGEANAIMVRQIEVLGGVYAANAVISGSNGANPAAAEENALLDRLGLPVRSIGTAIGNSVEASFPASVAIAAMSIARNRLFPPLEPAEEPFDLGLKGLFVTSRGVWRGESSALVVPAQEAGGE
jgi:3-oxoacyl-[acyl-carrier-protein] synthase II